MHISRSGLYVVTASEDQVVRLSHSSDLREVCVLRGHTAAVRAVVMLHDEDTIVSGALDYSLRVWSRTSGTCVRVLREHEHAVEALSLHPSGDILASGSHDRTVIIWSTTLFVPLRTVRCDNRIGCLAFSSVDGELLVGVSGVGCVAVNHATGASLGVVIPRGKWSYGLACLQGEASLVRHRRALASLPSLCFRYHRQCAFC